VEVSSCGGICRRLLGKCVGKGGGCESGSSPILSISLGEEEGRGGWGGLGVPSYRRKS